jgi:CelD/BcsL family acetyltransferase involved in cellulose biosynthesis
MADVVEINHPHELEHYYLVWNSLLRETRSASYFQSLDWLQTYWRHYGAAQRLRVLVVYSAGAPLGIVPLTVLTDRTRLGRLRILTYPLHEWGSYYGPVGPNPAATLTAAMRHLRRTPRDWDLIDLRWVDKPGHDRGRTRLALENAGLSAIETRWKQIPLIELAGAWDEYFSGRTSKFRNNIRRAEKHAAELGEVTLERHRPRSAAEGDGEPRWELYDCCEILSRRSWQAASTDGTTLCHEVIRPFLREMHAVGARGGAVDICLLRIGGQPAAFSYNYHYQGYVNGLRVGFDPQFAKAAPGNLLYHRVLRDAFERGDRIFDLGPGYLEAKRPWVTATPWSYRYRHYPLAAPRVQLLRLKHWLANRREAAAVS